MKLQDGAGYLRCDRAAERAVDGLGFVLTAHRHQHPACLHDTADAHGNGLPRHLIRTFKKARVGLNGALGQLHHMGFLDKSGARLVKPDVSVPPQAQKLEVRAAQRAEHAVVPTALLFRILRHAIGHIGVLLSDIDVVEEVFLHEITIALGMGRGEPSVFIQVYRDDVPKAQIALPVPFGQLMVDSHRSGPGGQPQHTVRLSDDLGRNQIGASAAHGRIIRLLINSHK